MNLLADNLANLNMFNDILDNIKKKNIAISFKDIMDLEKAYYIYSITANNDKSSLVVCSNILSANKLIQDLKFFSDIEIVYFPAKQIIYYDVEAQSRDIENNRMYAIKKINEKTKKIIVTTIDTLMLPMVQRTANTSESILIKKDEEMSFTKLSYDIAKLRV